MGKRLKKSVKHCVTAVIACMAVITVAVAAIPAQAEAAAKKPTKMSLAVTAKTIDIKGHSTITVKSVKPEKADKSVTFKSGNKKIATVSSKGVVTGKKAGKVKITVTAKKNKKLKKTVTIKVKDLKPTSLSLSASKATLYVGGTKTLKSAVKPAGVYCPVKWTSSNKAVATVSSTGKITAKKPGTAIIKVSATQKNSKKKYLTKSCKVTVKEIKVTKIAFEEEALNFQATDAKGSVKLNVEPKNATYKAVTYTSSDENVAKVDASGTVTTTGYGETTITAVLKADPEFTASYKVTVTKPENVAKKQVFVSPEWYKSASEGQQSGYENIFLAEVAYGKTENDKAYNEAHIPGAYHINSDAVEYDDWDLDGIDDQKLYDDTEVKPEDNFNIRNAKQLAEFLKNNGITKDTKVVLYGKRASDSSVTRVAFAMLYAGVEDVKVIDGGMEAWNKISLPTEKKVNEAKAGASDYAFGTTIPAHPEYILSTDDAKEKLQNDANFRLVSIRSEEEFRGEKTGYDYIKYAGEPLGAVWGHDTDDGSYVENGKVAGLDKVSSILEENDSSLKNELSFYCGTGWRATIPFLICYQNGMDNISVFDGGWWAWQVNWQKDPENWPIQKVSPEEAKTYGKLTFAKKEITTDDEGHRLMAMGANVAENKLSCWPERIRKSVEYTYGNEESKYLVKIDENGKVQTIGFGNAIVGAKTPSVEETTYKIRAWGAEDYFDGDRTRWNSMYIDGDTMFAEIKAGTMDVLDIRIEEGQISGVEAGYNAGHIKGSTWAPAWPTKTAAAQANVRKEAERIKNSPNKVVIICMAGEEGAQRAAAVLMDAGVPKSKICLLTGGGKNLLSNYKDQLVTDAE